MDHTSIASPSKDDLQADASFWEEQADYDQEASTEKGDEAIFLPEHPIVYMYDLQAHEEVIVHIADIAPYKYQTDIGKLLVLPKEEKRPPGRDPSLRQGRHQWQDRRVPHNHQRRPRPGEDVERPGLR
jgi:hypothetical protein